MNYQTKFHHNRQTKTRSPYPNAAAKGYHLNRLVDYLLTGATTLGIVVAILFLVTL